VTHVSCHPLDASLPVCQVKGKQKGKRQSACFAKSAKISCPAKAVDLHSVVFKGVGLLFFPPNTG